MHALLCYFCNKIEVLYLKHGKFHAFHCKNMEICFSYVKIEHFIHVRSIWPFTFLISMLAVLKGPQFDFYLLKT